MEQAKRRYNGSHPGRYDGPRLTPWRLLCRVYRLGVTRDLHCASLRWGGVRRGALHATTFAPGVVDVDDDVVVVGRGGDC